LTAQRLRRNQHYWLSPKLVVLRSGMGQMAAQEGVNRLLHLEVQRLISWGCATSLRADIPSGQLVLPRAILDEQGVQYACDASLLAALDPYRSCRGTVLRELHLGAAPLLRNRQEKEAINPSGLLVSADMESAAVARGARQAGVPFAVVRAGAVDLYTDQQPGLHYAMDTDGQLSIWRLGVQLTLRPQDLPGLLRLQQKFRLATASLRLARALLLDK